MATIHLTSASHRSWRIVVAAATTAVATSLYLEAGQAEVTSLIRDYQQEVAEMGQPASAEDLVDFFKKRDRADSIPIGFPRNDVENGVADSGIPNLYADPSYKAAVDRLAGDDPDGRVLTDHARRVTADDVKKNYEYSTSVSIAPKGGRYQASGVVIAGGFILTAGHVWDGSIENAPHRVWVGTATDDNDEGFDADGLELRVRRLIRHPKYQAVIHANGSQSPRANDIMVLELDSASKSKIRYHANLLDRDRVSRLGKEPWLTIRVVGFGFNRKTTFGWKGLGVQRTGSLPVVMDASAALYGLHSTDLGGSNIAMEFAAPTTLDYVDTCNGDSGAPGFVGDGGDLVVAAIVSRRIPGGPKCGRGGIYTIVPHYKDWIEKVCRDKTDWILLQ